jgi:hypothetical protein
MGCIRNLGSGIRKKPIPDSDPAVKKAPDPGCRIRNIAANKGGSGLNPSFAFLPACSGLLIENNL